MASMYETIMGLPLFKGISEEQVSLLLEKTSVEFLNYEDDEIIASPQDQVQSLYFILSGLVRRSHSLQNFDITLDEILGPGNVLGALHLYGLSTVYGCEMRAVGKTSLMKIRKEQYMKILQSDGIYIMNCLNFLSAAAQRSLSHATKSVAYSVKERIDGLIQSLCSPTAESITLYADDHTLAVFCGANEKSISEWRHALPHNDLQYSDSRSKGIVLKA